MAGRGAADRRLPGRRADRFAAPEAAAAADALLAGDGTRDLFDKVLAEAFAEASAVDLRPRRRPAVPRGGHLAEPERARSPWTACCAPARRSATSAGASAS